MIFEHWATHSTTDDLAQGAYNLAKDAFGFLDHASLAADDLTDLLSTHLPLGTKWTASTAAWTFQLTIDLTVEVVSDNDRVVVYASSNAMSRPRLDALRRELRRIMSRALRHDAWSTPNFGIMLLQIIEESSWHLQDFRNHGPQLEFNKKYKHRQLEGGWNAASAHDWGMILDNPYGLDLMTANDTAYFLLGRTIAEICQNIPDFLRVLHVEPVFRSDLVTRFLKRQRDMEEGLRSLSYTQLKMCVPKKQITSHRLVDSNEGLAEYLCTPHITFHGAPRSVIASIVRYGFLLPGEQIGGSSEKVTIRSGATYGVGVYSNPSLEHASMYGQSGYLDDADRTGFVHPASITGLRMIVCATLMGRSVCVTRDQARFTTEIRDKTAQSHVSPNGQEYIVFDKAQIIPCYVLHMDYGSEVARAHFDKLNHNPALIGKITRSRVVVASYDEDDDCPGARRAKKEALRAAALKWFPYGYGPATGTSFVVEDVGCVSDDEEEYGDFQVARGEQAKKIHNWQGESSATSWFDQYQTVRKTKKDVGAENLW